MIAIPAVCDRRTAWTRRIIVRATIPNAPISRAARLTPPDIPRLRD